MVVRSTAEVEIREYRTDSTAGDLDRGEPSEARDERGVSAVLTAEGALAEKPRFSIRNWLTQRITRYMSEPVSDYNLRGRNDFDQLKSTICKGDVLLVEGDQRVSGVIKYLTQSSWSHAVLYIGDELLRRDDELKRRAIETFGDAAEHLIVEALFDGVVASPLVKYIDFNVRLCHPHRLRDEHRKIILDDAVAAIGWRYDLRNILDLAVHLIFVSLLPGRHHKKRLLHLGSGASSQVICTSLLGQLFHKVGFPVLPYVSYPEAQEPGQSPSRRSPWSILRRKPRSRYTGLYRHRHPTLLTPRDFDLSPYFHVLKFNVIQERSFDYSRIEWDAETAIDEVG
jgi:hypothetical protein